MNILYVSIIVKSSVDKLDSLLLPEKDIAFYADFYELNMAAAYFKANQKGTIGIFEMFIRKLPTNRSYLVAAGLEQVIVNHDRITFTEFQ